MSVRGRVAAAGPVWLVAVTGLVVTVVLATAANAAYEDNEDRLLEERTQEAAAVLEAAIPQVETPLEELGRLVNALGSVEAPAVREAAENILEERGLVSLSVGRAGGEMVTVGAPPAVDVGELVDDASSPSGEPASSSADDPSGTVHVIGFLDRPQPVLGLVHVDSTSTPTVVYGELPLPADRISPVQPDEAFSDLHHAVYIGEERDEEKLLFASTMDLPLDGRTSVTAIPFGDSQLVLAMSPAGTLGGRLTAVLPWLVLVTGLASTAVGSLLVMSLHRRRRESDTLREEVEQLYSREHAIAHTLQRSLLPSALPHVADVEVAARYVAGARGTEVGGDWYDVIELDDEKLIVIVGDAAGRGVQAASVMAAVRYGTNAIAAQGTPPADVLDQVNGLDGVRHQFVTMLCGVVDLRDRSLVLARAGHPPPLVVGAGEPYFLDGPIGPPVGFLETSGYHSTRLDLPAGSTLLLFTDGLYERRDEDVDTGLERLRRSAGSFDGPLEVLLDHLYDTLVGGESRDDVAMLAIRFRS